MDEWIDLGIYESVDQIKAAYWRTHERALNTKRSSAIAAQVAQGRQYFESAQSSGILVRPVLLYYGTLSLSRAVVLFNSLNLDEAALSEKHGLVLNNIDNTNSSPQLEPLGGRAHGITAVSWKQAFARGSSALADLSVSVTAGTFRELIAVTRNTERTEILLRPTQNQITHAGQYASIAWATNPSRMRWEQRGSGMNEGKSITLKELTSLVPDLRKMHYLAFDERSRCYPAVVEMFHGFGSELFSGSIPGGMNLYFKPEENWVPNNATIRDALGLTPDYPVLRSTWHEVLGIGDFPRIDLSFDSLPNAHLCVKNDAAGNTFACSLVASDFQTSSLADLFAISFIMGMIARYYPSQWQSLLSRDTGDGVLPLLRHSMKVISERVPMLVLSELQSSPCFGIGYAPGRAWGSGALNRSYMPPPGDPALMPES